MRLVVQPKANSDLDHIAEWISKDDPSAAKDMIESIDAAIGRLIIPGMAEMGRPGRDRGTRELVETPYVIVYELDQARSLLKILAVFHAAQNR